LAAHGGRASGIDARTVSYGKPLVFTRSFSPPAFEGKEARFSLPEGCSLLVVDTFAGKKDGTSAMVEKFARGFGITAKPHEVGEGKRKEVREEYDGLWKKIVLGLKPDGKTLGGLMNENHALLRERGVSSGGIEKAVSSALAAGALGAKLTGGGGEGGAVIVLCRKKEIARIGREIAEETSFECRKAALADRGAGVD
jgi:mevalonate kinase